jgi:enterobactin synthetase component D
VVAPEADKKLEPSMKRALPDAATIFATTKNFIVDFSSADLVESALFLTASFCPDGYRDELFNLLSIDFPLQLQKAVLKRRAEYLAGRFLSQIAIRHLCGGQSGQVGIGAFRQPIWPEGLVGSISHSHGRVATIVSDDSGKSIGVDVEEICNEAQAQTIANMVLSSQEKSLLGSIGHSFGILTTLAFSSKETLFKALFPVVECYFGFESAMICEIDMREGNLLLKLKTDLADGLRCGARFRINFFVEEDTVVTWTATNAP